MTTEAASYIGWALVMFGAFVLTEGYYAFRQRAERAARPGRYWWVAGLIWVVGLSLIMFGLELHGSAGG